MKKKVSKASKRRLMIFGILSIMAIVYFFVTLFGYTYSYISLKKEENNLKNQLLALQDKKANLKIEIQKLNDPEYVARYAKENYLYSADGEYVLKIDSTENTENNVVTNNNNIYYIIGIIVFLIFLLIFRRKKKEKWNSLFIV